MKRAVVWGQLLFVLGCIGYSTYSFFQADFQQAFLPYPVLILYYLVFLRKKGGVDSSSGEDEPRE